MFLVDTNLLVYAVNRGAREHARAREFLEACRAGSEIWVATWSIFYEFLRVTTHPAVLERPLRFAEGWSFLEALAASPAFQLIGETERHAEVVSEVARQQPGVSGNHVHDFHIAALMLEHGVGEIRTADADFHRFRFLRVSNPVEGA